MRYHPAQRNVVWTVLFSLFTILSLNACGDANNVTGPPPPVPAPGPLTILTGSPLPTGTSGMLYDNTLVLSGGTSPYTWSLVPGSPALPNGLTLSPSTGNISGTPTTTPIRNTEFKLTDSKGESVQKVLSITINAAPTPLTILTPSPLPAGDINRLYAFALSPTGGASPYTWGLKAGTTPLPSGLDLGSDGSIRGTPTVTSTATHIFTLTDATSTTVEKALQLSIRANPLSITTQSPLTQGTVNQPYSAQVAASGGTGTYTWSVSPALPSGLTLNASTGQIGGTPSSVSVLTHTFTVTDQTPPTPQRATKTLRLTIGSAPPDLIITTNSPLPAGTVTQPYNATLTSSGGTGAKTWDLSSGSLPTGLNLSSTGVISGTPTTTGTSSPTIRVRDSGNPQDIATKPLSITITLPAAPQITTTSLPAGIFDVAYNQTIAITGGTPPLVWGVISGTLPAGLSITSNQISFTPTATGSFPFTVRVTDATNQFDDQPLTLNIVAPPPPRINSFTLPTGTVNQPYPRTELTAAPNGALPYTWTVTPALAGGTLTLNLSTGVIIGTPTQGTNGVTTHTFRVTDSTLPINQFGELTRTLTINANVTPVSITTTSLPSGTVGQSYTAPLLAASQGTSPYNWSNTTAMPPGLSVGADGAITGTPTATNTNPTTFKVLDSTVPNQQSATKSLTITITAAPPPLTITTTSPLPVGKVGDDYGTVTPASPVTLTASGGTPPYTWSTTVSPPLPSGLSIDAAGTISGTPTVDEANISHTFTVADLASTSVIKVLSLTIAP